MEKFAFVIHPITAKDVAKRYRFAKYAPDWLIEAVMRRKKPQVVAHLTGIKSLTGAEAEGWLIGCPYTPRQFMRLSYQEEVLPKLKDCAFLAEELGARIMGLGAFSSVAGDGGVELAECMEKSGVAITTGNSYTVATAVEGAIIAAELMGISLTDATAAVVGATGSIGATCARLLGQDVGQLNLIGRNYQQLAALAHRLGKEVISQLVVTTNIASGLRDADIVVTVSSAIEAVVQPQWIKRGAVVVDVARPRDVSKAVQKKRNDVLVIEGGVIRVPGAMRCFDVRDPNQQKHFSFGFPQGTAYACMSETMALALDQRYKSFSLGATVWVDQVDFIDILCRHHGFKLDGFRAFERAVTNEQIEQIRCNARQPVLSRHGCV